MSRKSRESPTYNPKLDPPVMPSSIRRPRNARYCPYCGSSDIKRDFPFGSNPNRHRGGYGD